MHLHKVVSRRSTTITLVAPALLLLILLAVVSNQRIRKDQSGPDPKIAAAVSDRLALRSIRPVSIDEADLKAFDGWLENYSEDPDTSDLVTGVLLAAQRREAMKALIQADPASALAEALSFEDRESLPEEIQQLLELPVRTTGDLEVISVCGLSEGQSSRTDHFAVDRLRDIRYQAFPVGARQDVTTKRGISIQGIAVDDVMALAPDPVRNVPEQERISLGLPENTIQVGGSFFVANDEAAIADLRARLIEDERTLGPNFIANYRALRSQNSPGIRFLSSATPGEVAALGSADDEPPIAQSPHTEGAKTMLYIRARFADQDPAFDPIALATLQTRQAGVEQFWTDNSFGKSNLTTTFTDTVTLADPTASWPQGLGTLLQQAREAALAAQPAGQDWDHSNFDFYTVVTSGGSGWGYGGVAFVGGTGSHLNGAGATNIRTAAHEFGHNLGLLHANYWRTDSPSPIGRDSVPGGYQGDNAGDEHIPYGHKFSTMSAQGGSGDFDAGRAHFSTGEKVRIDWLVEGDGDHVSLTSSSTVRLYRHDIPEAEHGAMTTGVARSIKINRDSDDYSSTNNKRRYWLTHRWLPTNGIAETWLRQGLQIDWQRETYGGDGSILLDMTPFSNNNSTAIDGNWTVDNNDKEDSALIVGRTYTDTVADIHITPTGKGGSSPNQWFDVVVNLDTQAGNSSPDITAFSADATEVGTGVAVNFTMSAIDSDGDTLAYSWDFGDNSIVTAALNSNTATKSWSSAGQYLVRTTVSDMKGGIDTRDLVITVGSPANVYQISGRVLHGGLPVEGARVSVGNNDQTWTEGDGTYTLAGLATGDYTVSAAKHGLTLNPQFNNPAALSTLNAFGKDFHASEGLSGSGGLTMAVMPYEIEIPIGASARFTAQGWDLAGNSAVISPSWSVAGGGTIDSAGLFTASTTGTYTVTATEGSTVATATVSVLNVSAIGILTIDGQAAESGNDTGLVRIQRYGDISAPVTVKLTLGGTAISGSDYTAPSTSINFSGGQSSVDISITPLNDFEVETAEIVVVGLASDPAYQVLGTEVTATVSIDDDGDIAPEVTIISPTASPVLVPPGTGLVLKGSATDDGLPNPLRAKWSLISGPTGGTISFSSPQAFETLARFSVPGTYQLALVASDGPNSASAQISVAAGVQSGTPSTTNEIIYYTFDEGSGSTANDSRGGNHNGTLANGATWTLADGGITGTAVQLDGVNDQVNIADSSDINTGSHNERTIAFWFQAADSSKPAKQVLFEEGGASRGLNVYLESGILYFGGWNNNENGWDETFLTTSLSDDSWHHVAMVLDAPSTTNGELIAYLDGFEITRGDAGGLNAHSADCAIGAKRDATRYHDGNSSGTADWFEGLIDEFHLWNRAISATEVTQLFASQGEIGAELTLATGGAGAEAVVIPNGVGLVLDGTVSGPGTPSNEWTTLESPGGSSVTFGDNTTPATTATFSNPGYYLLRFTATGTGLATGVEIHVHAGIDSPSNPSTANQVIYYSLDEGTGTTAGDTIGGNHNGTLTNGPAWTAADGGVSGSALSFDGTDDVVAIANSSSINSGTFNQRAISVWFKATDPGASGKEVLYEEGGATRGLNLYLENGRLYFGGWNGNTNGWNQTYLNAPVNADQWHQAVLCLDTPSDGSLVDEGFKAYLDGVLIGIGEGAEMTSHTGNIGIGGMRSDTKFHDGNQNGDGSYFSGLIDEFHLWTGRILTPEEIGALYSFGNIGPFVDAGTDTIDVPGYPNISLSGSSSDDGRWTGALTHTWSVVSSPTAVTFSAPDPSGIDTVANLTSPGLHVLRLAADDGKVATFSDVSLVPDNPYFTDWGAGYPALPEEDLSYDANPDNDGYSNLEEYAYGGDPGVANPGSDGIGPTFQVVEDTAQNYFDFQYRRRRDYIVRGLSYTPQFSSNMSPGSWTPVGITETEATVIDSEFELVTARVDEPFSDLNNNGFVRMNLSLSE